MRKLLDQITRRLRSFIEQRDDVALVLESPADDAIPMLKILEGIEESSPSDFFWTFTDKFDDAASYAEGVVRSFSATHEAVRLSMEKEGMAPWPPLPPVVQASQSSPVQRLRELAAFSRELVPIPGGGVVVWTYFPLEIADASGFAELMGDVVAHDFPFPWCHHLRFVVREDDRDGPLHRRLKDMPRVQRFAPDLGMDAIKRSMEEEVADESLPLAERMATLMLVAGNDLAFNRYPDALEKYALLVQYHAPMNNHPMAALALNGMGEVYQRMGDLEQANEAYQAALVPATQGDPPPIPVFLNIVINLVNLRVAQHRWAEAEGYCDVAQQLATVARDGPTKVWALESRGACQQQQAKLAEAEASWRAGAVIAAQLEDAKLCADLLERLRGLYVQTRQTEKERELRRQLADLGRPVER